MSYHMPVLLNESIEGLNITPEGIYVDLTFGGGGHSRAIMEHLGKDGRLLAFDQDEDALANAIDDNRFTLIHENFKYLKNFLRIHNVRSVDGILADLGVSSHQFDVAERGFSSRFEGQLDLRMDRRQEFSAHTLVNEYEEDELARVFRLYGELPNYKQIARAICQRRASNPIETTFDLRESIQRHLPRNKENKFLAMVFQAIRIEVNGEMEALRSMLEQTAEILKPGGRLVVISYHSLEDRLVKNWMRSGNFDGDIEKDFFGNPITPFIPVSRKAITPTTEELNTNNRSRSAKLRVAEKKTKRQ